METKTAWEALRAQKDVRLRLLFNYWETVKRVLTGGKTEADPDFTPEDVLRGDSELLGTETEAEVKQYFVNILELLECGLSKHPELYRQLRPKVLRGGNDAIRNIRGNIANYHVLKVVEKKSVVTTKVRDHQGEVSNG